MNPPLISVVVPVYNAERYLASAIDSIRQQTLTDWELIAVDDGSTDASRMILEDLAREDDRIRVVSRPNTGIVGALNDGIAVASGRYVARMDGDDLSLPSRFALQAEYLEANPECVLVATHVLRVDPDGWPIGTDTVPLMTAILARLLDGAAGVLTHPSIMMRRDALIAAGGYRAEYQWAEDYDLYLGMAAIGSLANLPEILLQYRLHHESVNMKKRDLQGALVTKCLHEACGRLGIPQREPTGLLGWLAKPRDPVSTRRGWAIMALASGHYRTARKHAVQNILAQPWKLSWWKLLVLSLLKQPNFDVRAKWRALFRPPTLEAI